LYVVFFLNSIQTTYYNIFNVSDIPLIMIALEHSFIH